MKTLFIILISYLLLGCSKDKTFAENCVSHVEKQLVKENSYFEVRLPKDLLIILKAKCSLCVLESEAFSLEEDSLIQKEINKCAYEASN